MAVVLLFRVAIVLAPLGARYVYTARGAGAPGYITGVRALWDRLNDPDEDDAALSAALSERLGYAASVATYDPPYELRRMTAIWSRNTAGGVPQDPAMTTHHFINITSGSPDATWTTTDYEDIEEAFYTAWLAIIDHWPYSVALSGFRWQADGPAFKPFGAGLSPTLRTASLTGNTGTSSAEGLPPQCAVSVTEVTGATFTQTTESGVRTANRWGRFYLPAPAVNTVSNGRLVADIADDIADAFDAFYETCGGNENFPVMYSPTTGGAWLVTDIHVDDLFDVIRSRRYETPLSRHSRHIAATD